MVEELKDRIVGIISFTFGQYGEGICTITDDQVPGEAVVDLPASVREALLYIVRVRRSYTFPTSTKLISPSLLIHKRNERTYVHSLADENGSKYVIAAHTSVYFCSELLVIADNPELDEISASRRRRLSLAISKCPCLTQRKKDRIKARVLPLVGW